MDIEFYKKGSKEVVCDFIENLKNNEDKRKIIKELERLRREDLKKLLRVKIVKKIEDNLYELRPNNIRIFFIIFKDVYYLLHIIIKKRDKIPRKDLNIARTRKKEIII